ncbi:MAG: polysaccharide deacetylase family protein [Fulvivirga sp.]
MNKSKVVIICPNDFIPERTYIIDILAQFLGLKVEVRNKPSIPNYHIKINNKQLTIEDHFFRKINEKVGYLKTENLPEIKHTFTNLQFEANKLPVLYGKPNIQNIESGIHCQIDIFATCFFMLTRWEEFVIKERDQHGRFPARHSLAFKNNFLNRPIVNEYVEILRKMLSSLDPSLKFQERTFTCIPTHDIDHIAKWGSLTSIRKKLAHDFITKRRPWLGVKNLFDMLLTKSGIRQDPFDTFAYITELSKANNLTSRFYFLCGGKSKYDLNFDIEEAKPYIEYLQQQEQIIGFHPSYSSHKNLKQWRSEKLKLESISQQKVKEGRQHYLMFEAPVTWKIWDDNDMEVDSSVGYSEVPGFRCGTCYSFPVFDFLNREKLGLVENPLILMETTLITYMKASPEEANEIAKQLYFTVKKYNGNFTFLWHNSAMHTIEDKPYLFVYENIIKGFPEDGE